MKHRKTIEIREALAIFDKHIERLKSLRKYLQSNREKFKKDGRRETLKRKLNEARMDRMHVERLRQEVSALRYVRDEKPPTLTDLLASKVKPARRRKQREARTDGPADAGIGNFAFDARRNAR